MQVTVTAAVAKINNHFFIKTVHVAAEAKVFANFLFIYFSRFHFLKGILMVTFTNKMAATDFFPPNPEDGELWLPSFIIHEISTTNAAVLPSHQPAATTTFEVIYLFIFIFHFSASIISFFFLFPFSIILIIIFYFLQICFGSFGAKPITATTNSGRAANNYNNHKLAPAPITPTTTMPQVH